MRVIKIGRRFQVTIPPSVRDQLDLAEGDFLQAAIEDGAIVLRPQVLLARQGKEPDSARRTKGQGIASQ